MSNKRRGLPQQPFDRDQRRAMGPDELRFSCHAADRLPARSDLELLRLRLGRPFALKSGRPCQPLEIALPTKTEAVADAVLSSPKPYDGSAKSVG